MNRERIKSSLLRSVGYDPKTKTLAVEFLRRQNEDSRRIYHYQDVPQEKYDALMGKTLNALDAGHHSVGAYFLVHIRPNYNFVRVEEPNEEDSKEATPPAERA